MNSAALSVDRDKNLTDGADLMKSGRRPLFTAPRADWREALYFMLSMAALGLEFYPALLLVLGLMVRNFRNDRYHFMIQILLFSGIFALLPQNILLIKRSDILIVGGFVALVLLKKSDIIMKRTTWALFLYFMSMLALASLSVESMTIQLRMLRENFSFIAFAVPLWLFVGRRFDTLRFFKLVGVYSMIMVTFYVLDGFVVGGWLFIPASPGPHDPSTFYAPDIIPLSFPRKYPQGLTFLALMILPVLKVYRLNWKQWGLIGLSFAAMRTITILGAFVVSFLCFIGRGRQVVIAFVTTLVAFVGLYFVDSATGEHMRIASTVNQFAILKVAEDREDLAEFGTTRMAQIIPKMELLFEQHREWIGFGFLHPELSNSNSVQVFNDLYSDVEQANENASAVEETHITTILQCGFLGLIIQTAFYIYLYFTVRRCRLRNYYLIVLIFVSIGGFGGFVGLNHTQGLLLPAWAYAVVLLDHYRNRGADTDSSDHVSDNATASSDRPKVKYVGPVKV